MLNGERRYPVRTADGNQGDGRKRPKQFAISGSEIRIAADAIGFATLHWAKKLGGEQQKTQAGNEHEDRSVRFQRGESIHPNARGVDDKQDKRARAARRRGDTGGQSCGQAYPCALVVHEFPLLIGGVFYVR